MKLLFNYPHNFLIKPSMVELDLIIFPFSTPKLICCHLFNKSIWLSSLLHHIFPPPSCMSTAFTMAAIRDRITMQLCSRCSGFVRTACLVRAPVNHCATSYLSPTAQPRADVTTQARAARPLNQSQCATQTQTRAASEVAGGVYSRLPHSKRLSCAFTATSIFQTFLC